MANADLLGWLGICRRYEEHAIESAKLKIISSEDIPTPSAFALAVSAEREAKEAVDGLSELRRHPAYVPIMTLDPSRRSQLAEKLRTLGKRVPQKPWSGMYL